MKFALLLTSALCLPTLDVTRSFSLPLHETISTTIEQSRTLPLALAHEVIPNTSKLTRSSSLPISAAVRPTIERTRSSPAALKHEVIPPPSPFIKDFRAYAQSIRRNSKVRSPSAPREPLSLSKYVSMKEFQERMKTLTTSEQNAIRDAEEIEALRLARGTLPVPVPPRKRK